MTGTKEELLRMAEQEEKEIVFDSFDNEDALQLGLKFIEAAKSRRLPVAIDIAKGGQQLFHYAFEGTAPHNDVWVRNKNALVHRYYMSSFHVRMKNEVAGPVLADEYAATFPYAANGGSFPLIVRGAGVVGTVAVSGLKQEEDHALVVEVLRAFLKGRS